MSAVVPDLPELFEEAYERAGLEMRSGYDLKTIRRSLNLLCLEWANRGLNLFTVEGSVLPLVAGQATYSLPSDTIDLIEHMLRTGSGSSQQDTFLERISVSTYAQQANKALQARPTQLYVDRGVTTTVTVWPVPDSAAPYSLAYYRLRYIEGLASGLGGDMTSVPPRFVPALVAGLAVHVAAKRPSAEMRVPRLKAEYEEQFALAAGEDRDRASVFLLPGGR